MERRVSSSLKYLLCAAASCAGIPERYRREDFCWIAWETMGNIRLSFEDTSGGKFLAKLKVKVDVES